VTPVLRDEGVTADEARSQGDDTRALFFELAANREPALRDRLVTAHLGLAHHLARRYANRGEPYEDLVQVASLAIVKSVDRFEPERGVEFTTFATRTVIGELKRHFRDKGWAVRAPRRVQELYLEIGKVTETLSQELGRSPMVSELASATGTTEEAVLEALEAGQGYRTASIDATDRNEEVLASRMGEDDTSLGTVEDRELLAPAIATLAPREQLILQLRFAHGLTQSEIAARVGISQMHVSRLLAASLERLRETVAGTGAGAGKARGPDGRDSTTSTQPGEDGGREGRDAS
jgi:RNA polymerase sigma-B factor